MFYVYGHYKYDTGEVFYIGKGQGDRRNSEVDRSLHWKHIVKKHGYWSDIIEEFETEEDAFQYEKDVIAFFGRRDLGTGILVNLTEGGIGVRSPSVETREKMAAAKRGKKRQPHSEETKMKMRAKRIGNTYNVGRKLGPSPLKGKPRSVPFSDETKVKMRLSARSRPPVSLETRMKRSNTFALKRTLKEK